MSTQPSLVTRHLEVARTARYHLLGDPAGGWEEVWYLLHGYGQRADDFLAECAALASPERLLVAPEGLSRFYARGTRGEVGASWMTREDRAHEIDDYVRYLDRLHAELCAGDRAGVRVGVLGFSQGTATASRWCVLGAVRPRRLVLWGSGFPPDLDPERVRERLAGVNVALVLGDADPVVPRERAEREVEHLRGLVRHATAKFFAGGHQLDAATLVEVTSA